jgi:predicted Rossmann fold nucleotide-binding protein DprA/Smf involved in DNA uptake
VLIRGWPGYPRQLVVSRGANAPPVLFAIGNVQVLERPGVGFCGSRKASLRGLEIAGECARHLALSGFNVVSGYAHGVDLAAHQAALEAGGTTTLVLAEGILHFRIKASLKRLAAEANFLAISELPPRLPWSGRQAMARNHTICGLSTAMILVESGAEGGTFECGKAALEQCCPLFVIDYAQPPDSAEGNAYFLARGAQALRRSRAGEANLEPVIAAASGRSACNGGREQAQLPFE